ncbi:MAG: hypothetical protein HDR86_08775 [Bacteroides sp.]|nr:hypothetical protein [Bacteroides sp.]
MLPKKSRIAATDMSLLRSSKDSLPDLITRPDGRAYDLMTRYAGHGFLSCIDVCGGSESASP